MQAWLKQLRQCLSLDTRVVVVTVINVKGSAPRETGARMIVGAQSQRGTVGGGNLEYRAVRHSHDKLLSQSSTVERQILPLGPSLGQCCGGSVELLYEVLTTYSTGFEKLPENRNYWWCRCISEGADSETRFIDTNTNVGAASTDALAVAVQQIPVQQLTLLEHDGRTWCCEPLLEKVPQVFVFGAGHVGAAVVSQLGLLSCRVLWIDERSEFLPELSPDNTTTLCTDTPAAEVDYASAGTSFIVMTHSHSLDYEICQAIFERSDYSWFGLIGSTTKRRTFERRLRMRGVSDDQLQRLQCPVGIESLRSRKPEVIALSLAACLVSHWEDEVTKVSTDELMLNSDETSTHVKL